MRGWRADGSPVELTSRQEAEVAALLADPSDEWRTVLHTAVRLDGIRRGIPADDPAWDVLARAGESPAAKLRLGERFAAAPGGGH